MSKWIFRDGPAHLAGYANCQLVSGDRADRTLLYQRVLETAAVSDVCNPMFSHYFVRAAIAFGTGSTMNILPAGNREFALFNAIHSEVAATNVCKVLQVVLGGSDFLPVIGFAEPSNECGPCGDCLDFLRDEFPEGIEFVSGPAEGGNAYVFSLDNYLVERHREASLDEIAAALEIPGLELLENVRMAISEEEHSRIVPPAYIADNPHPERLYGAFLVGNGNHAGGFHVSCHYRPTNPILDAIRKSQDEKDFSPRYVIITRNTAESFDPASILYADRQDLLAFACEAEALWGKEFNPRVVLVNHYNGEIISSWTTTARDWYPFPFTPKSFGAEAMQINGRYLRSKIMA